MTDLYKKFADLVEEAKENKTYNNIKILESPQGRTIKVNGEEFLNMCSNNYLGLANDPRMVQAAKDAIDKYGVGPGAVRSISGSYQCHIDFENALAKFKGVEACILVQSGFQANTTILPTIATEEDWIISDQLNHASIIDGIKLSKYKGKSIYAHKDMAELEARILEAKENISDEGNIFIYTDGVFSMDGDICPLPEINALAKKYGCYTIIDDAHGEGVLGKGGRGTISHFGLEGEVDFEVGTLSKAFGIAGGFVGCRKEVVEYFKQKSRPFLFSSGVDASLCGAGLEAVKILGESEERVEMLWDNAKYFQTKLKDAGLNLGVTETPITPVIVGDEALATKLTAKLFEKNILVSPIMFPTVAKGKARIRCMVSATHTKEDLDHACTEIVNAIKELS